MKQMFTGGLAALMLGATALAGATPAAAHDGYGYNNGGYGFNGGGYGDNGGYGYGGEGYHHHDHDNGVGLAVGAGLLALIVGVAIASHSNTPKHNTNRYDTANADRGDDNNSSYDQTNEGQRLCTGQAQVWDSNHGRYVTRRVQYACESKFVDRDLISDV